MKTKYFRYVTQFLIFGFIVRLIYLDLTASESDITVSPEAYCPLGGLETLVEFITNGGKTLSHLHSSNVIIFALIVLITLFFRSGFCGWLCPFGTVQDVFRYLGKKLPFEKKIRKLGRKPLFVSLDKYLRYFKYFVLVFAVGGAIYFTDLIFRDYDPFVAFIKVAEIESWFALGLLIFILILSLFIDRPWCKYACPLGAVIGIIGKISPMRFKRNESDCTNCNLCTKACPMNINVTKHNSIKSIDCNSCMKCMDACPKENVLEIGFISLDKGREKREA